MTKPTHSLALLALLTVGCGEEPFTVGPAVGAGDPNADLDLAQVVEVDAGIAVTYRDDDFVEADTNRDPFRSYARAFVPTGPSALPPALQRAVIMPRTGLDEMRLIAIVSGVAVPLAMIVDRDGTGYTVQRGDYLGRPEIVQTGGEDAVPITLNWRVDRIRAGEVVLTRDDPTAPNRPPLTRVILLREPETADRPI